MTTITSITFTPREVAVRYKLSVATVYRLIGRGEIPAIRIGGQFRVPADALEARFSPQERRRPTLDGVA